MYYSNTWYDNHVRSPNHFFIMVIVHLLLFPSPLHLVFSFLFKKKQFVKLFLIHAYNSSGLFIILQ